MLEVNVKGRAGARGLPKRSSTAETKEGRVMRSMVYFSRYMNVSEDSGMSDGTNSILSVRPVAVISLDKHDTFGNLVSFFRPDETDHIA